MCVSVCVKDLWTLLVIRYTQNVNKILSACLGGDSIALCKKQRMYFQRSVVEGNFLTLVWLCNVFSFLALECDVICAGVWIQKRVCWAL